MVEGRPPKVGIITLPGRFNFGNRLQNYAAVRLFESMGICAESLEHKRRFNARRGLEQAYAHLTRAVEPQAESLMSPERHAAFARFDTHTVTKVVDNMSSGLRDEYRWFSVGSDQVWNPGYIRYEEAWYFLKFARPHQRIALSPSIGVDSLNVRQAARVCEGVRGFSRLSVREDRGSELIRQYAGREALVTIDPTLSLDADDWRGVADSRLTPTEPYVLAYLLGGNSDEASAVLETVTKGGRVLVVQLSDRARYGEPPAGPGEFISLIEHADHVVTDSFHASVFSFIMGTPLTIVRRHGENMFSRLSSLAATFGLENRVFGSPSYTFMTEGSYEEGYTRLGSERSKLRSYLEECLRDGQGSSGSTRISRV